MCAANGMSAGSGFRVGGLYFGRRSNVTHTSLLTRSQVRKHDDIMMMTRSIESVIIGDLFITILSYHLILRRPPCRSQPYLFVYHPYIIVNGSRNDEVFRFNIASSSVLCVSLLE
jgi:hypothetical protein